MIRRRAVVGTGFGLAAIPAIGGTPGRYLRQVLVFYYPWYGNPQVSGSWSHRQGPAGQASRQSPTFDTPTLGMYDSRDPASVTAHIAQARAAGITSLVVRWWGTGSYEDRALPLILAAAARAELRMTVFLEQQKDEAAGAAGDISYLTKIYAIHPAWLRAQERPVFFGIFRRCAICRRATGGGRRVTLSWSGTYYRARRQTSPLGRRSCTVSMSTSSRRMLQV